MTYTADPKGVLALDLGCHTGYSVISRAGEFDTGVLELGPKKAGSKGTTGNGKRFHRFRKFVKDMVKNQGVRVVCYEQALVRHKSGASAAVANGLVAILEELAEDLRFDLVSVHNKTLKIWATGNAAADKDEVIGAAWHRWPHDRDRFARDPKSKVTQISDDQVDSLWVLNWALHYLNLGEAFKRLPQQLDMWSV